MLLSTDMPTVVDLPTSESSLIKVSEKEFRGETYVDVRRWVKSPYQDGQLVPTPKGIIFRWELVSHLIRALCHVKHSHNRRLKSGESRTEPMVAHDNLPV